MSRKKKSWAVFDGAKRVSRYFRSKKKRKGKDRAEEHRHGEQVVAQHAVQGEDGVVTYIQ
jgi:hypothetical protein